MADRRSHKFLLASFTAFYCRTAAIKKAAASGNYGTVLPDLTDLANTETGQIAGADLAYRVSCSLRDFLEKQARTIRNIRTDAEIAAYREAQYLMAVLADEIFILELEWPGRDFWENNLLEKYFFKSCSSATTFFRRLDLLLDREVKESLHEELAIVYLMCLRLGFSGQYRDQPGRKAIAAYQQKLLRFIGYEGAEDAFASKICQQAYDHSLNPLHKQRLSSLISWRRAGSVAVLAYLLASYLAWEITVLPLR